MAKSKQQLHDEAVQSGAVPEESEPDDYTAAELEQRIGGDVPAAGWVPSHDQPVVAPDGHVVLSEEDIKNRA